jgi:hypothetical protein
VHPEHAPWKSRIEVSHERGVLTVEPPELLQIVGEFLAAAKELLVAGEAAAERVAPRVDDRRARK